MSEINILNQKITFLKNNIQEILDKCSKESNDEIIESLNIKKHEYMKDLEMAMGELKIHKDKLKLDNEYKKVVRATSSIEYHRVKNKSNSTELLENLKQKREKAQRDYEKMQQIQEEYSKIEEQLCKELPGFLFFHKDIIDTYGKCPYIIIDESTKERRQNWLDERQDNGQLYYQLYDKFILKKEHQILIEQRINFDDYFESIHNDYLSESQLSLLNDIKSNIQEYVSAPIKTKKLKDKFKIIVNNLSNLVLESELYINEYFSALYKMYIPVNSLNKNKETMKVNNNGEFISKIYNDKIVEYKELLDKIDVSTRFIKNTINNLNTELYEHIYHIKYVKKKPINQTGKYFKKWSGLNDEEKLERYHSYVEYFIIKYLVEPNILENEEDIQKMKDTVKKLIQDDFKRIKFKDIKWNVKRGMIEQIRCLKFDEEKMSFYLTKEIVKEATEKGKSKKISSVRSILTKDTEKVINEELVIFLIATKKRKKLKVENIKELKDEFIEKLKDKLKFKRITLNDKIQVFKKFDEIYNVISNNDSSSVG
jgi:hypothetical protein